MKICILGSSSGGNCTVLYTDDTAILIDCGFSARYTEQALSILGLSINEISGIFITHSHSDHVSHSMVGCAYKLKIPLFASETVIDAISDKFRTKFMPIYNSIINNKIIHKEFDINLFSVPHDSKGGCNGFLINGISSSGRSYCVALATDLGKPDKSILSYLTNATVLIIESNHDLSMLNDSKRPQWLKDRIITTGHLSNDQCADVVEYVLHSSIKPPEAVILAHISNECNTVDIALKTITTRTTILGFANLPVYATFPRQHSSIITIE